MREGGVRLLRVAAALLGACAVLASSACGETHASKGRLIGKKPPEIHVKTGHWLGTKPFTWADLAGRVVLVEFGFHDCPVCEKMAEQLASWHERFAPRGLFVFYVEDGRVTPDPTAVREALHKRNAQYAALYDTKGEATARFSVQTYPYAVLVDRTGRVVWDGLPLRNPAAVENAIVEALGK